MRETKGPRTTSNVWESGHDKPRLTSAWEANLQHISLSSQGEIKPKLNHAREIWDELCNYKTFLRVEWEIFPQRRVMRIFLVTIITHFSIHLFLFQTNSKFFRRATNFFHRPPEKSCSFNHIYIPPKIAPHNKYAYSSHSSAEYNKEVHMLLRNRKFNQLIIFSQQFNCQRAVTYPPLFSDMPIRRAAQRLDWCNF